MPTEFVYECQNGRTFTSQAQPFAAARTHEFAYEHIAPKGECICAECNCWWVPFDLVSVDPIGRWVYRERVGGPIGVPSIVSRDWKQIQ